MPGHHPNALKLSACTVNLLSGRVQRGGTQDTLSAKELACLSYLAKHPGQAVSRDELLEKVWHYDAQVISRTVDATVRRLRKKIEAKPSDPEHLLTVHGAGYRLEGARPISPKRDAPAPELLGRQALLDTLRADEVRLCTLSGPPGVGKSQLARALAHQHVGTVLWADLGQAGEDLEAFLPAALGLRAPLDQALAVLHTPLVVLDNAQAHTERLARLLDTWLNAAPHLRVLCTSRAPLGHAAETVRPVPALAPHPACTLLGGHTEDHLALAQALGHNPLALTLAREPCELLGPQSVLTRLQEHGEVFGRGQPILDAAVQASWRLLTPEEQRVLSLASLAPAGLSLQALEHWAGPGTLAAVQGLLRHALLQLRPGTPSARLFLPFPVAPFASKHVEASAAAGFQAQMLTWGARCLAAWDGPGEEDARATLLADAPNLLHAAQQPGPQAQLCLAYWAAAVYATLAPATLLRTLEAQLAGHAILEGELAVQLSRVQRSQGQLQAAAQTAEAGLRLDPDPVTRMRLLDAQAYALSDAGQAEEAAAIDQEAADLVVPPIQALSWQINRANRQRRAADPQALDALDAAWTQAHRLGAHRMAALAASHLAAMYTWTGDLAQAEALLSEALKLVAHVRPWEGQGVLLQQAASLALGQMRLEEARSYLDQAEVTWRGLGRPYKLSVLHLGRGRIHFLAGDPDKAIAELSRSAVTAKALGRPERGRTALVYRGMILSHQGQLRAALKDLTLDLKGSPVLQVLRHTMVLLIHLRNGDWERAEVERRTAPDIEMQSLKMYQTLAHASMDLLLHGDADAASRIASARSETPPSMEFKVLWGHLDWVLSQV